MSTMHEIGYEILGDDMQFVKVELDPGEAVVCEAGAMMYLEEGITMQAIFGDGSNLQASLMDKLLSAGKRVLTGESMFMAVLQNTAQVKRKAAFAAPYPGKIVPMNLKELGGQLLAQKDSFLCAAKGVSIGIAFTRRFGAGLFGGEGFILEKLEGDGCCFVHAGGTLEEKTLAAGETLRVDTGCIVAMQPTVDYDIQFTGSVKTMLFGGEGLFYAVLRGPGRVWLQSLPFSRLASRIYAAAPQTGRGGREEGSVLGRIGNLLDGDTR